MRRFQRLGRIPAVEALEDRRLLAAPITEFPIPAGSSGIAAGPDGNLWCLTIDHSAAVAANGMGLAGDYVATVPR
jgi:hypothetical protein